LRTIAGEESASADEVDAAIAGLADFIAEPATLVGDPRVFQLWSERPD
jgi:hypothetical protein